MKQKASAIASGIGLAVVVGVLAAIPVRRVHADGNVQNHVSIQTRVRADAILPGHILVRIRDGVDIQTLAADYGTSVADGIPDRHLYSLLVPLGSEAAAFAAQLRTDPRVVFAETDISLPSPEMSGTQIAFAFDAGPDPGAYINQTAYQQVHLGNALSRSTGAGVVVAVLDTGATFDHPDLHGHYLDGYNAIQPDQPPLDLPDGITNSAVGHGTMIAGIIARLAPDAQILPVRVLNADGIGSMLNVAKGIHYAVTQGANIISMSFGALQLTDAMREALDEAGNAGVIFVAPAGNNGLNQVQFPAAGRGALAVAAVEADNRKSPYSNFGSFVRIVAPGTGIRSTYWTGGYATWSGTSFAVPFVTAAAALVFATGNPDVASAIRNTAHSVDSLNPAYRGLLGNGIIDIEAAVLHR